MKECPKCQKNYYDETMEFCLDDGSKLHLQASSKQETLTVNSFKPIHQITQDKTVQFNNLPDQKQSDTDANNFVFQPAIKEKKEIIKQNVAVTSQKVLEVAPIVLALAHNFWQWLYLYKQPVYQLSVFLSSYNFLVWIFLLLCGFLFGGFSLKYSKNKGFAITALVVLAINVILSIAPK